MTDKPTRFVEMDWREALRKYADGYDVLRMDVEPRPGKVAPDYITDSLDDVLQGYHYMVDQMSGPEDAKPQEEKEAAEPDEDQTKDPKPKTRRQYINAEDKEAITELYKAGQEMEEIAEALGISESLFCRLLRHELSKDDQTRIISVIDEIANSREVIKHADFDQAGSRADRAFGV